MYNNPAALPEPYNNIQNGPEAFKRWYNDSQGSPRAWEDLVKFRNKCDAEPESTMHFRAYMQALKDKDGVDAAYSRWIGHSGVRAVHSECNTGKKPEWGTDEDGFVVPNEDGVLEQKLDENDEPAFTDDETYFVCEICGNTELRWTSPARAQPSAFQLSKRVEGDQALERRDIVEDRNRTQEDARQAFVARRAAQADDESGSDTEQGAGESKG